MPFIFKQEETLRTCQTELQELIDERERIDRRIIALKQTLAGLMRLKNDLGTHDSKNASGHSLLPIETYGLTDACRSVIRLANRELTAGEIRREVETLGIDFSRYSANPLAAVHQVLSRLKTYNEIEVAETTPEGTTCYRWKGVHRKARSVDSKL